MTIDVNALILSVTNSVYMCLLISMEYQEFIYISNLIKKNMQIDSLFIRIVIADYKLHYQREIKQDIDPLWRKKGYGTFY